MSELMNVSNGADFRWHLLTSVSALALLGTVCAMNDAKADDSVANRPSVWIELGGQLEHMNDPQVPLFPPFMASITQANLLSALNIQKPLGYSLGGEGKVSFQPDDSDWIFSASFLYGRANGVRHQHQQTANAEVPAHITAGTKYVNLGTKYPDHRVKLADAISRQSETHSIVDFQAGKDFGFGMFGNHASSVISGGIRFAQFNSKSNVNLHADPDVQYPTKPISSVPAFAAFQNASMHFHDYAAMESGRRSFHGLGPNLAWNGSLPLAGGSGRGEILLDLGADAAVLFGRQKASGSHRTSVKSYHYSGWATSAAGCNLNERCVRKGHFRNPLLRYGYPYTAVPFAHHSNAANFNRMRSVTVPNLGGFAGVSFRYSNAKVSFGYRADLFFGVMDGGLDTAKSENRNFYGPFATISVGIGG